MVSMLLIRAGPVLAVCMFSMLASESVLVNLLQLSLADEKSLVACAEKEATHYTATLTDVSGGKM